MAQLTALKVGRLKDPGKYPDGDGLYLQISGAGTKSWLFRYMLAGKRHWMGLGPYPLVGLADARAKALDARRQRHEGTDPIEQRRAQRASQRLQAAKGTTFKACALAYIKSHRAAWTNPRHVAQWETSLEFYVYPVIGALPVAAIDTGLVLQVLEPSWTAKYETMSRVRGRIESILAWAKTRGYRDGENPARWKDHLDHSLPAIQKRGHHKAMPYNELPAFMVKLRAQNSVVARCLEFTILTAARRGEAVGAQWSEIEGSMWTIPAERMKGRRRHIVPLSTRTLNILKSLQGFDATHVFPDTNGDDIHYAMVKLQAGVTIHGFRSSFRDWAGDKTPFDRETIEFALAHGITDSTEAAYRRSTAIEKRRELMAAWAAFCEAPG
jgi:integrase